MVVAFQQYFPGVVAVAVAVVAGGAAVNAAADVMPSSILQYVDSQDVS